MNNSEQKSLKKRNRGHNKRIEFSEEIVTKDTAKTLLLKESTDAHTFFNKLVNEQSLNDESESRLKKSRKRKNKFVADNGLKNDENVSNNMNVKPKKIKRKKELAVEEEQGELEAGTVNGIRSTTIGPDNSLSKRAKKRMKYLNMLETNKIESQKNIQKCALNYLSNWKYNKSEWKFEKLKQIWLAQNLYESSKIDEKYWETVVEYFQNSQGKVHQEILAEAIKIIENEEIELNDQVKFQRARDIVLSLQ